MCGQELVSSPVWSALMVGVVMVGVAMVSVVEVNSVHTITRWVQGIVGRGIVERAFASCVYM